MKDKTIDIISFALNIIKHHNIDSELQKKRLFESLEEYISQLQKVDKLDKK